MQREGSPMHEQPRCICRLTADCAACAVHLEIEAYAGHVLIVPRWATESGVVFCLDRRPAGVHRPAAACGQTVAAVCAVDHTWPELISTEGAPPIPAEEARDAA